MQNRVIVAVGLLVAFALASRNAVAEEPARKTTAAVAVSTLPVVVEGKLTEPKTEPQSIGKRTAGQVLTVAGLLHMAAGIALIVMAEQDDSAADGDGSPGAALGVVFGGIVLGSGVVLEMVGVPLWAMGATRIPVEEATLARSFRGPRAGLSIAVFF